ncbi:MAG: transglutaminase domain-containing protein [Rhodoblastus sp.]|nr:transglutaminase domain-containing protein [Rhodoblastus sp.]
MVIDRRSLMAAGAAAGALSLAPRIAQAGPILAPALGAWRTFEVTTRIDILMPEGATQAWIPLPAMNAPDWFQPRGSQWKTNGKANETKSGGADLLHVEWAASEQKPYVEIISKMATRDRAVDLTKPGKAAPLSDAERKLYRSSTDLVPLEGIVKHTADRAVGLAKTDIDKARAIYEWVVDNSYRRASTRGCGTGDVAGMLKSGDLGGKCADLNALFVGLARAAGIPARDVYGLRIAPSRFGYKSLGANSDIVTKAQHCRAEVFLDGYGWVAMDPADVRKVMLEEPLGNLAANDAKVVAARKALFGSWETNWLAYNSAHDVDLPGSKAGKVSFLMYPQGETNGEQLDPLDPDNFRYTIRTKETTSA